MLWRRARKPDAGTLRRTEDVQGLQAALAYSDPIVDRYGEVIDRGARVRVEAVRALAEVESDLEAVRALAGLEREQRADSPSENVHWLARGLEDAFEPVARAAAESLGTLRTRAAVGVLIEFLVERGRSAAPSVRRAALDAVASSKRAGLTEQWAAKVVDLRTEPLDDFDREELAVIVAADTAADPEGGLHTMLLPRLEADVAEESPRPAEAILAWCGHAPADELRPRLMEAQVPEAVVRLAGLSGDQSLLGPLVQLLRRDRPTIRREAATALGGLCDTAAVMPLMVVTTDPDLSVRRAAVGALDRLGSAGVTAAMALLANSAAASALGEAEPRGAVAGEGWAHTLKRLAERTARGGRGRRHQEAERLDRLTDIRRRYNALLNGPESTNGSS